MKPHMVSFFKVQNRVSAVDIYRISEQWPALGVKECKSVSVGCGFVFDEATGWQIAAGTSQLPSYSEGFPSITVPVVCLRLPKLHLRSTATTTSIFFLP